MNNLVESILKFEHWQWVIALFLALAELLVTFLLYRKTRANLLKFKGPELQSSQNSLQQLEQSLLTMLSNLSQLLEMAPMQIKSKNLLTDNSINLHQNLEKEKVKLQSELDRIIDDV